MRVIDILNNDEWIRKYDFYEGFMTSTYYGKLVEAYEKLNYDILFVSDIHGKNHIERVVFYSVLLAYAYKLDDDDTYVLINAASLHDTQRQNDGWDTEHGRRAAELSTPYAHDLKECDQDILKAVIAAHSREDEIMDETLREYVKESDFDRAKVLAKYFKDADGLDRVRINHLDPAYLRNEFSKGLVDFAYEFYENF